MILAKTVKPSVLILIAFLLCTSVVLAEVSSADRNVIRDQIALIEEAVNRGDADPILNVVSPNAAATLKREIEESIAGKSVHFQQSIRSYEDLGGNQVRVKGRFAAEGVGWSVSGLSNYYVFERTDDSWLLVDTDFHHKLGPGYVWGIFGRIGRVIGIIIAVIVGLAIIFLLMWRRRSRMRAR